MAMSEQEWVAVAAVAVDSSGIQWWQCQASVPAVVICQCSFAFCRQWQCSSSNRNRLHLGSRRCLVFRCSGDPGVFWRPGVSVFRRLRPQRVSEATQRSGRSHSPQASQPVPVDRAMKAMRAALEVVCSAQGYAQRAAEAGEDATANARSWMPISWQTQRMTQWTLSIAARVP